MATISLDITGMHCDNCIKKVKDALTKVDGVWGADVDLENGKAEVQYDDSATEADKMIAAVEGVGYEAKVAD